MSEQEIKEAIKNANKLLSENGFGFDGSPKKKKFPKNKKDSKTEEEIRKQKFFEKFIIIKTPMGNGSR